MVAHRERHLHVLLDETDRGFELPPESRWIRERRPTSRGSAIALAAAATLFIIVVGGAIAALRVEPRLTPASGVNAFAAREDAAWASVRVALPAQFVVLRPTWMPAEFRGSGDCLSPTASVEGSAADTREVPSRRTAWTTRATLCRTGPAPDSC